MDSYVRRFIQSSLIWLALGVVLGTAMTFWPGLIIYRTAHMHANLLGFVSMMIFGVAYHVLPRFSGTPLHKPSLASAHLVAANTGLLAMVVGWLSIPHARWGFWPLRLGALVSAVGVFLFIYNVWRTLSPQKAFTAIPGRKA